jgi:hypothetical protein
MWFRTFLAELGFHQKEPMQILTNNQGSISLMKNLVHHSRLKHIDISHHYVRELVSTSVVAFEYYSTNEIYVDLLTKRIPRSKHYQCMEKIGLQRLGI